MRVVQWLRALRGGGTGEPASEAGPEMLQWLSSETVTVRNEDLYDIVTQTLAWHDLAAEKAPAFGRLARRTKPTDGARIALEVVERCHQQMKKDQRERMAQGTRKAGGRVPHNVKVINPDAEE